jgi:predicted GIY-YIG superfamily endonuclease
VPAIAFSEGGLSVLLHSPFYEKKMSIVYLVQSISYPQQTYIGVTSHLEQRFKNHNAGRSPHTSKYKPWRTVVVIRFNDDRKARSRQRRNLKLTPPPYSYIPDASQ